MTDTIHITDAVAAMLRVFENRPGEELRAAYVAETTGFSVAHVRRSLRRLEQAGLLNVRDEYTTTSGPGYAARLHYRLADAP
jgi:DNA-binding GntR family transcriptional regulator